jgi:hypothetical protein
MTRKDIHDVRICESRSDFCNSHLDAIAKAAGELYDGKNPVRILDIATGGNGFNPLLVKRLANEGIDYRLIISDVCVEISMDYDLPGGFLRGYKLLEERLLPEEMKKVTAVIANAKDMRSEIKEVHAYVSPDRYKFSLEEALANPRYSFLRKGYNLSADSSEKIGRAVAFEDGSFDMVVGVAPFGNIAFYGPALKESARVLKKGGYLIVEEDTVEKVNSTRLRFKELSKLMKDKPAQAPLLLLGTLCALYTEHKNHVSRVCAKLDEFLEFQKAFGCYRTINSEVNDPTCPLYEGDLVRDTVLVYKK